MGTLDEAKHWGATYALYRVGYHDRNHSLTYISLKFCNNLQLNRVLPPGPREYWAQLAEEHRLAPDHLKWQYDPDPFAAKAAVEERQKKAAAKRDKPQTEDEIELGIFDRGLEVRMGTKLRDTVEAAVKQVRNFSLIFLSSE
jgi:ATP-dependent RNA helicase DHX57